ncbi:MAG: hypothetical protein ABW352_02145 [Polyangiales bacterium]
MPTRLAFFTISALVLFWTIFPHAADLNEFRDAQVLFNYEDVAVRTVRKWFELPLWNPYYCGGLYALGTPQSRFAAPPFLLSVLFGPLRAAPLIAMAMSVLGMEGFYRYARTRTASALGPALMAPIFAGNGFFAFSFFHGWLNFYGFELLPWVLFGIDLALRGRRQGAVYCAAAFAFIVGFGGTYGGPLAGLLAIAHVLRGFAESPRKVLRASAYRELGIALALSLCMCAFRLWPVIESLIAAPRLMAGAPGEPVDLFRERLFWLSAPGDGNYTRAGQQYTGMVVCWLFALGLLRKRSWGALVLLALSVWVSTGFAYEKSAFGALRELPVLHMLRYPERFLLITCLLACEVAAQGIDWLLTPARLVPKLGIPVLALAIGLAIYAQDGLVRNQRASAAGMWRSPAPLEIERPFAQARGNRWLAAHYASISRGSLNCWEAYPLPMSSALRGDLPQEEYLLDPASGTTRRLDWSPNGIDVLVELRAPGKLLINQNYHPGWHSSVGTLVDHEGLIGVELPAGKHEVHVRFRPRSAVFGGLITLASFAFAFAWWTQRRRVSAYAAGAVPVLLLSAFTLYTEPLPKQPPPTNADGSLVVVDALPPDARPLRVEFDLPIEIAGSRVDRDIGDGIGRVEVFWRVKGLVPQHLGISVHFESSKGRFVTADHDAIGASFLPRRAPRDELLRDAASAVLDSAPDEHWRVYVCLWYTRGPPDRVKIHDSGGAVIDKDRVLVGEF